ncbi:MAG: DUF262 domain-containing protein [Acidobacteria bacterium]|nr:DUF262 domain-containing protein [Acidobacteriota bacterium]
MTDFIDTQTSLIDDPLIQDDGTGIASEPDEGEAETHTLITQPFDPKLIRVEPQPMTIDLLVKRIRANEINLAPEFQRKSDIWNETTKSRLIESLLIRLPLPAFYFDATDDEEWIVVDGLQRLTTLKQFIVTRKLKLKNLEFLTEYEDKTYDELPRNFQRRIDEAQVTVYLIKEGSSAEVKFTLFKRINTGGLPLSPQEIRHAIYQGEATALLKRLSASQEFKEATSNSIRNDRMADQELVLRFLAFTLTPPNKYAARDLDTFLNETMKSLNTKRDKERQDLEKRFLRSMKASYSLFGKYAFRKRFRGQATRPPISKALFEAWSVNLNDLSDEQLVVLEDRKDMLNEKYITLFERDERFNNSVTFATAVTQKIAYRFARIRELIEETLS